MTTDHINRPKILPGGVLLGEDMNVLAARAAAQRKIDKTTEAQQHAAALERERLNPTTAPLARDHTGLIAQHEQKRGERVTAEQALQMVSERLAAAELEYTQSGYATPDPTIESIERWCSERQRLTALIAGCKQLRGMWAMAVKSGGY